MHFSSGVGETAALMLTIASPVEQEPALALRARAIRSELERVRAEVPEARGRRASIVLALPRSAPIRPLDQFLARLAVAVEDNGQGRNVRVVRGGSFAGIDVEVVGGEGGAAPGEALLAFSKRWLGERFGLSTYHPDAWSPMLVEDLDEVESRLHGVAGAKYSLRQLRDYASYLSKGLERVPLVSKVIESGSIDERLYVVYSQERLEDLGLSLHSIPFKLASQNRVVGSGALELPDSEVPLIVSQQTTPSKAIGDLVITKTDAGAPVRLRSLGDLHRGYQLPPRLLNGYSRRDLDGSWITTPAITLAIQMRPGEQIGEFGALIDQALSKLADRLPEDLVIARTSDQPRQVRESVDLFLKALYEAIALVVLIAFIGFRDWRASVLLMLSIPITLALSFGAANLLGIRLQQVSIASLIIALGLLVDDPVVAGDAIKRSLAQGRTRTVAAWLGPTKLSRAIFFATATNVIAYLPFILVTGNTGDFLYSLPIMLAAALIASRLVSMSFVPLLGSWLLRPPTAEEPSMQERQSHGFTGFYARLVRGAIEHRVAVLSGAIAIGVGILALSTTLKVSFFPTDVQYLATVDVWLPVQSSVPATAKSADEVAALIAEVMEDAERQGLTSGGLVSITSFAGGGSPRF